VNRIVGRSGPPLVDATDAIARGIERVLEDAPGDGVLSGRAGRRSSRAVDRGRREVPSSCTSHSVARQVSRRSVSSLAPSARPAAIAIWSVSAGARAAKRPIRGRAKSGGHARARPSQRGRAFRLRCPLTRQEESGRKMPVQPAADWRRRRRPEGAADGGNRDFGNSHAPSMIRSGALHAVRAGLGQPLSRIC